MKAEATDTKEDMSHMSKTPSSTSSFLDMASWPTVTIKLLIPTLIHAQRLRGLVAWQLISLSSSWFEIIRDMFDKNQDGPLMGTHDLSWTDWFPRAALQVTFSGTCGAHQHLRENPSHFLRNLDSLLVFSENTVKIIEAEALRQNFKPSNPPPTWRLTSGHNHTFCSESLLILLWRVTWTWTPAVTDVNQVKHMFSEQHILLRNLMNHVPLASYPDTQRLLLTHKVE